MDAGVCPAGAFLCSGSTKKICDGQGGYQFIDCAPGTCNPVLGCVVCDPTLPGTCNGNTATRCKSDGSGYFDTYCDPVQGSACDATTGRCTGVCSPDTLGSSYIGCDYYPTVTANIVASSFDFAVAVSNTTTASASVTITQGASTIKTTTVAPNDVQVITLPWVEALKKSGGDPGASLVVGGGAYRLRSTQPVTVYQFSPLQYSNGGGSSYTNDASLLLPVNAWTGTYRVMARQSWRFDDGGSQYPGFYAVTASEDGTTITVTPPSNGQGVVKGGISGLAGSGAGQFTLNAGDVAEVFSVTGASNPEPYDLTGTLVSADKPVQVIAGSQCTFIPYNVGYCDHLEESIFPVETLATEYLVTAPLIPTGGTTPKVEMVRVVAVNANTSIATDPAQPNVPSVLANAGDWFEIALNKADFKITASDRILVAQYMTGQDVGGGSGDPAMALAVSTAQFRSDYLFHAPTNYEKNYVNVVVPSGATVTLDGNAVTGFVPIGTTGWGVARVALSNSGNGNHSIDGNGAKIGISVYGYGQYTSYWYPGGLNLRKL